MKKKRNLTSCLVALCAALALCAMLALPVSAADDGADAGTYASESTPEVSNAEKPTPGAEENGSEATDDTDGTAGGGGAYESPDLTNGDNESTVDDGTASGGGHTEDEGTTDNGNDTGAADGTAGGAGSDTESGTNAPVTDGNESSDTDPEKIADTNGFSVLLEGVKAHFGEIFSALAFVGSIIVMFCYKSGLLPVVKEGLRQLAGGVRGLGEHTVTIREDTAELRAAMERELAAAEGVLTKMADALESLEKKLGDEAARDREISALKQAVSCEIDMLYNVFMAAAMPQYLKEQLGESVAEMKAMLKVGGTDEGKD